MNPHLWQGALIAAIGLWLFILFMVIAGTAMLYPKILVTLLWFLRKNKQHHSGKRFSLEFWMSIVIAVLLMIVGCVLVLLLMELVRFALGF